LRTTRYHTNSHGCCQPGSLIFKKQTLRGFWLLDWYRSAEPETIKAMFDYLVPIIAAGKISTPVVATYGFDKFREAISEAAQSGGRYCSHLKA
jgi:mitochondrial enoyl-[acyl-carrier protein] reductase / trans-2-enoyl-CoA reductase